MLNRAGRYSIPAPSPPRARLHPFPHKRLHLRDLAGGGRPLVVVAHDLPAHGAVAHHRHEVHGVAAVPERGDLVGDRPACVAAVRPAYDGGEPLAVQALGAPSLGVLGGHRPVGVGVEVDEARRHVQAGGVHDAGRGGAVQVADPDDPVAVDRNVAPEPRVAAAVQDTTVADDHVVVLSMGGRRSRRHGRSGEHRRRATEGEPAERAVVGHLIRLRSRTSPPTVARGVAPATFAPSRTTNSPFTRTCTTPSGVGQVVLEGGGVDDPLRVEHGDVGVGAGLEAPFPTGLRRGRLQAPGGHDRDPRQPVDERDQSLVPHVASQEPGERACAAGVGTGCERHPVRSDDHELPRQGFPDPLRTHHVDDDRAPGGSVALEALRREALARVLPLDVAVSDAEVVLPAGIEDGGLDAGGGRGVGVRLGGHVEASALDAGDQVQHRGDRPQAGAVHVDDVEGRPGRHRVGDDLLHRADAHAADVRVDRRLLLCGELEDPQDLFPRRSGVVLMRHSDPQGAFGEALPHGVAQGVVVFGSDGGVASAGGHGAQSVLAGLGVLRQGPGRSLQRTDAAGHRPCAGGHVGNGRAEVQDGAAGAVLEKRAGAGHAALQLQRGGDPVAGLELVGPVGLAVGVEVDEARRNDEAGRVDYDLALQRLFGDRRDLRAADADVAGCVEARFGVDDAAAREDHVVPVLRSGRDGGEQGQRNGHRDCANRVPPAAGEEGTDGQDSGAGQQRSQRSSPPARSGLSAKPHDGPAKQRDGAAQRVFYSLGHVAPVSMPASAGAHPGAMRFAFSRKWASPASQVWPTPCLTSMNPAP